MTKPLKHGAALANLLNEMSPDDVRRLVARRGTVDAGTYLEALGEDIERAIQRLESKASKYHKDDEEKLTTFIAERLEAGGHAAECEADNNGHVDLKVTKTKIGVLYLAEAKIHRSYEKNRKGMRQLLTRYASGKEKLGGFLLYITSPGAKRIVDKWRTEVRCRELSCTNVSQMLRRGVFDSTHTHRTQYPLRVRHYGVFMHYDPKDRDPHTKRRKKRKRR